MKDIDYNDLNGYIIKDPIARTMLQSMWEDKFKEVLLNYKSTEDILKFMYNSSADSKIYNFTIKTIEVNDNDCKLILTVTDFNAQKWVKGFVIKRKDYDNSSLGEMEVFKNEMEKYNNLTHSSNISIEEIKKAK